MFLWKYIMPFFYKGLVSWSLLDSEREASFAGLCLVCSTIKGSPALHSWECDEDAFGLCGIRPTCTSSSIIVSMKSCLRLTASFLSFSTVNLEGNHRNWSHTTMNLYWKHCKMRNEYITGNVDDICLSETTWTGLKKYYIGILLYTSLNVNRQYMYM